MRDDGQLTARLRDQDLVTVEHVDLFRRGGPDRRDEIRTYLGDIAP